MIVSVLWLRLRFVPRHAFGDATNFLRRGSGLASLLVHSDEHGRNFLGVHSALLHGCLQPLREVRRLKFIRPRGASFVGMSV
jgi:hypothetical protein